MSKDRLDRLYPYLLFAVTLAAFVPVLESGISAPISADGYEHLNLSIQNDCASFLVYWRGDAHPILYPLVLRILSWFGYSKMAYLSVSIIPGMASIFLLGLIAARLCKSRAIGLLAAAAYASSAVMREIIIDIRSYSLALSFVLAAFYCLMDFLGGGARRSRSFMLFGIFTSLAIASEYYAILFFFACLGVFCLLLAVHPPFRGHCLEWASRDWSVPIMALGLPLAVFAGFYQIHLKHQLNSFGYLSGFYWSPGSSRIDFVLRNLRADLNYMLPVEMRSAGVALGVLSVFAPLLLYRALSQRQSGKSLVSGFAGLMPLLLLAELIVLSFLQLYPFGGDERHQSILFPFFTMTACLLLDQFIDCLPISRGQRWVPAGIVGLAAAAVTFNSFGIRSEDAPHSHAIPAAALRGGGGGHGQRRARPASDG